MRSIFGESPLPEPDPPPSSAAGAAKQSVATSNSVNKVSKRVCMAIAFFRE
jgi:hypothetical protein